MRQVLPLVFAALVIGPAASGADAPPAERPHCFSMPQQLDWRKGADNKTLYFRTDVNRVYRFDLANACAMLDTLDPRLVLAARTGGLVCSALDLDIRVSDGFIGPAEPCEPRAMTELTPAEVAALPKSMRP